MMQPGHEDCCHEIEHIMTFQGPGWVLTKCLHEHQEEVQADDKLGTGPVVADYCHCCDTFRIREAYR